MASTPVQSRDTANCHSPNANAYHMYMPTAKHTHSEHIVPGTSLKWSLSSCLLAASGCLTNGSPFKYSRSNTNTHTCTFISDSFASLRFRVDNTCNMHCINLSNLHITTHQYEEHRPLTWKGNICWLVTSNATASVSNTHDLTLGRSNAGNLLMMSGYLVLLSS